MASANINVNVGVIAGSGLYSLSEDAVDSIHIETPYSGTPVEIHLAEVDSDTVAFLPRHGADHKLPPHQILYKANIWALKQIGVLRLLAVNAVGGINPSLTSGDLVIPNQLIDYTWGREHTFFDTFSGLDDHIDFSYPYDEHLRQFLTNSLHALNMPNVAGGVYGCTQGPRLETAAEIQRLALDGCDVVGQTGMPEAALAKELGIAYASICLVVNKAAGLDSTPVSIREIRQNLETGMNSVKITLLHTLKSLANH